MQLPAVAGLSSLESGQLTRMPGSKFSLPPGFDANKYSSKWEEQGPSVQESEQPQILAFANCQADGWAVYKTIKVPTTLEIAAAQKRAEEAIAKGETPDPEIKKSPAMVPYTRVIGKVVYVLMYRPKELQRALNQIYANQSREMVGNEIDGNTVSIPGVAEDHGILSNADLRNRREAFDDATLPEGYLKGSPTRKPAEATELHIG